MKAARVINEARSVRLLQAPTRPSFDLGACFASSAVSDTLSSADIQLLLRRHARGDWGTPPVTTVTQNLRGQVTGKGTLSSGHTIRNFLVWIITKGAVGHRVTSVLFPEDY